MAIDVLSESNFAPIIVGDDEEMTDLQSVGRDAGNRFHLIMAGKQVPLSPDASTNFVTATHLLLVSVTETDEISMARKVRIDNLTDSQELSPDQREAIAKALSLGSGSPRKFYKEALTEFRRLHPDLAA